MEAKLGAILGDPNMMAQIMNMAQQLGGSPAPPPPEDKLSFLPEGLDMGMITKLAGIANSANIDKNQQFLLQALRQLRALLLFFCFFCKIRQNCVFFSVDKMPEM